MAQTGKGQNFRQQRIKSLARAPEPPDVDRAETRREEHPRRGIDPRENISGAIKKIQRVESPPRAFTRMARQPKPHPPPPFQTPILLPAIRRANQPTQPKHQTSNFPIHKRRPDIPRNPLPCLPEGLGLAITFN